MMSEMRLGEDSNIRVTLVMMYTYVEKIVV